MRPVCRTLGLGNTTGNFIEEVGRGNRTVERSDKMGRKCIQSLEKRKYMRMGNCRIIPETDSCK